jgi:hypothetical protein
MRDINIKFLTPPTTGLTAVCYSSIKYRVSRFCEALVDHKIHDVDHYVRDIDHYVRDVNHYVRDVNHKRNDVSYKAKGR